MSKNTVPGSRIGTCMLQHRLANNLTQVSLSEKYKVSPPAIFKFEKGFITPSLELWERMAKDMGVSEKQALLFWVHDRLPEKFHNLIETSRGADLADLAKELDGAKNTPAGREQMRNALASRPETSPALKKFLGDKKAMEALKPSATDILLLARLDVACPMHKPEQFRDALLTARDIAAA